MVTELQTDIYVQRDVLSDIFITTRLKYFLWETKKTLLGGGREWAVEVRIKDDGLFLTSSLFGGGAGASSSSNGESGGSLK